MYTNYTLYIYKMSATNTKNESIPIKLFNSIIKYNNETTRLLDLLIFNIYIQLRKH